MGYTHYWTQSRAFNATDWAQIVADVNAILRAAEVTGIVFGDASGDATESVPDVFKDDSGAHVMFNGLADESHETFSIDQKRAPLESWQAKDRRGWGFCKTARKPYDVAVTACLIYLESVYPDHYSVSSDGDTDDWQAGIALARCALPRLDNVLDIPANIRWNAQFKAYPISGNRYFVAETVKGEIVVALHSRKILATFPRDVAPLLVDRLLAIKRKLPTSGTMKAVYGAQDRAARLILQAAPMWGGVVAE